MYSPDVIAPLLLAGIVLFVVLVVAWIVLPIAVIGTKPILRRQLEEMRKTNELLAEIARKEPGPP